MNYAPNWPRPVRQKLRGRNLPIAVELAFVEMATARIEEKARANPGTASAVTFEGAISMSQFCGWAAFSWDGGQCYVADADCGILDLDNQ